MKKTGSNNANIVIHEEGHLFSFWPGSELPGYRPLRIIGQGGRSTVIEAHDQAGNVVAVKLPFKENLEASKATLIKILAQEGQILNRISHENVVKIIRFDINGSYILMERLSERSLFSISRANKPSIEIALSLVIKLCEALKSIHSAGFLHLDLKPGNVLFRDQLCNPVIVDFGSARPTNKSVGSGTIDCNKLGSKKYLFKAPEQLMALEEKFGPQTDFFALGIILYWFICDTVPYSNTGISKNSALTLYQSEYKKAVDHMRAKAFPTILITPIQRLLRIDMRERPKSADEILGQLRLCLEKLPNK